MPWSLRFPSPELVASAAALFEPTPPWAHGRDGLGMEPESGRFRITIGPGVVRLGWTNPVRAEKASQRVVNRHRLDVATEVDRIKAGRDMPDLPAREITEWSVNQVTGDQCAAPSPSSTTHHWSRAAVYQRW